MGQSEIIPVNDYVYPSLWSRPWILTIMKIKQLEAARQIPEMPANYHYNRLSCVMFAVI